MCFTMNGTDYQSFMKELFCRCEVAIITTVKCKSDLSFGPLDFFTIDIYPHIVRNDFNRGFKPFIREILFKFSF